MHVFGVYSFFIISKTVRIRLITFQLLKMGPPVYSKSLWPDEVHPRRSLLERLFHRYEQHRKAPASDAGTSSENESIPYAVVLTENYRCHAKILEFPSDCFYGGQLVPKGDQSTHESIPVLSFYAAHGVDKQVEGGLAYYNDAEVDEVVIRVDELVERWPKDWPRDRARQIGVLTPYRDQVLYHWPKFSFVKRERDGSFIGLQECDLSINRTVPL